MTTIKRNRATTANTKISMTMTMTTSTITRRRSTCPILHVHVAWKNGARVRAMIELSLHHLPALRSVGETMEAKSADFPLETRSSIPGVVFAGGRSKSRVRRRRREMEMPVVAPVSRRTTRWRRKSIFSLILSWTRLGCIPVTTIILNKCFAIKCWS